MTPDQHFWIAWVIGSMAVLWLIARTQKTPEQ